MKLVVDNKSTLSRFYGKLSVKVRLVFFTSIEMMFWYIFLMQNGYLLHALYVVTNDALLRNPDKISTIAKGQITEIQKPDTIFRAVDIYYAIMKHLLLVGGNDFRYEFESLLRRFPGTPIDFVVSNANHERKWSCGLRSTIAASRDPPYPGFNLYGILLSRIYDHFTAGTFDTKLDAGRMCRGNTLFQSQYRKTVILLSDSYAKYIRSIEGGTVLKKSGGKYRDLVQMVLDKDIRLEHYKYVIISCGFNCARGGKADWDYNYAPLEKLINVVNQPKYNDTRVIFSSGLNLPSVRGDLVAHTRHIRRRFEQYFTDRERFVFCDWSDTVNTPFMLSYNRVNYELFDFDQVHLNHKGFTELFRGWFHIYPELASVSYEQRPYAYEEEPNTSQHRVDLPVAHVRRGGEPLGRECHVPMKRNKL